MESRRRRPLKTVKTLASLNHVDFGLPGYNYAMVDHVIFDMDGLLQHPGYVLPGGQAMLAKHGKEPDYESQDEGGG